MGKPGFNQPRENHSKTMGFIMISPYFRPYVTENNRIHQLTIWCLVVSEHRVPTLVILAGKMRIEEIHMMSLRSISCSSLLFKLHHLKQNDAHRFGVWVCDYHFLRQFHKNNEATASDVEYFLSQAECGALRRRNAAGENGFEPELAAILRMWISAKDVDQLIQQTSKANSNYKHVMIDSYIDQVEHLDLMRQTLSNIIQPPSWSYDSNMFYSL